MHNISVKIINSFLICGIIIISFNALAAKADSFTWNRIEVHNVSGTKATIAWSTSLPTTGLIRYGLKPDSLTNFLGDSQLRTDHETELINLKASTLYYFTVTARVNGGDDATSFSFTFTTTKLTEQEKAQQEANQQIPGKNDVISIDGVSGSLAAISWTSSFPTKGTVSWNIAGRSTSSASVSTLATTHQMLMKNLKLSTTYQFTVTMKDKDNTITSIRGPFTLTTANTKDQETTPLIIGYKGPSDPNDDRLSPTGVTVSFTTNHLAKATVSYKSIKSGGGSGSVQLPTYTYEHQASFLKLKPNTEYQLTITANDPFSKSAKLSSVRFKTPSAEAPAAQGRLVKIGSSPAVYYVYASGRKKVFATAEAFFSYGHTFAQVQTITSDQLASIPDTRVIKTRLSPAVYALEGLTVRPIISAEAFLSFGYNWNEIELVSPADLQSYSMGQPLG